MRVLRNGLLLLLAILLTLGAGCTSPESGSPPGTSANPVTTVVATTTVPPYTELSELAIQESEVPFPVEIWECGYEKPRPVDPVTNPFGMLRSYTCNFASNRTILAPGTRILNQIIGEYTPANATQAFAGIESNQRGMRDDPTVSVVWLQDPEIGDQSLAATGFGGSSTSMENPTTFIVFRKGAIIEMIAINSRNADFETLRGVALAAAAKIPPAGESQAATSPIPSTPLPVPARQTTAEPVVHADVHIATPPVALAGPVEITLGSKNTIGLIAFSLSSNPDEGPADMNRMEYTVTTPGARWNARSGDPSVRLTWVTGDADNYLTQGEVVRVELYAGNLDCSPSTGTTSRISIEVKPAAGASLVKTCTLPSARGAGQTIECP